MQNQFERAKTVLEIEARAILALKDRIDDRFGQAVQLIKDCRGKLILTGIGKSGQIAQKLASTFSSTGTPAIFLHPSESSHGDLGIVRTEDVVLALSYGGNSGELSNVLQFATRRNIPVIAMTGNLDSDLAKRAVVVLDIKVEREACPLGLAPTASSTASLALGDALAMVVLQEKGFSTEDFAEIHPGGGLGTRLARVKDLMHSGSALPLFQETTPMREILSTMSRGDVRGVAGIMGAGEKAETLIGIITDGDVRRRLEALENPLELNAGQMMAKNPRTVDAQELAEKALFMMEQFRIQVLFVVDKTSAHPMRPQGLIHIQDLLNAKLR